MAKTSPSATEAPPLPPEEAPPSEAPQEVQVEAAPVVEGAPAPPVQEEEKPDYAAQLRQLPDEERERLLEEVYSDRLQKIEQSAQQSAYDRLLNQQARQQRANEGLQATLRNLDNESDETKRAQHIGAFAEGYAQQVVQAQAQEWRTYFDDALMRTFGFNRGQYEAAWVQVHQQTRAKENRAPTDADFLAHVMGEKFMPKTQMSKEQREEISAAVEEAVGKRLAGQPSPVSLGPGESGGAALTAEKYKALSNEERAKLPPDQIDAMTRRYLQ